MRSWQICRRPSSKEFFMLPTVQTISKDIRKGATTPLEILDDCLARVDRYESQVRAWVFIDRDRARVDATRLTEELQAGHWRGPLHGIPLGIKDIFDVFDWPTA